MRFSAAGGDAVAHALRDTIRAPDAPARNADADALQRVRAIAAGSEPPLTISSTLGEGGMGIVQLGTQRSLGREVALKTLRAGSRSDDAIGRLVREGVVTGSLEHPNVVPVYELTVGADGMPVLVMKRVEGSTWTARMKDGGSLRDLAGAGDLLEWNLRTLMSVCQAVHFAHARGVIHRDLKPDNVMVGGFGEVYLVDWGIAVRGTDAKASERSDSVVGTPAYMAPEMLLGEAVTPRTDVYLLGAILFEIVVGRAPHEIPGGMGALIRSVLGPAPELPSGAPEELAVLARTCMDREPSARPESAEDVRRSLADFLRHRGSAELATRAEQRRDDLERALADDASAPDRIQRLYGETAFGFRAALEAWPDNGPARLGFGRATRALIRWELTHGMARLARARLADLLEPDVALRAEVDQANRLADDEARRDAELRSEHDPRTGRAARVTLTLIMGTLWTLQPVAQHFGLLGARAESHLAGALMAIAFAVVWIGGVIAAWSSVRRSRLNRQLAAMISFVLAIQVLAYAGASILGLSAEMTQINLLFLWFAVAGLLGVALEPRLLAPASAFLIAFFVGAKNHHYRLLGEAGANLVFSVSALYVWRDRPPS